MALAHAERHRWTIASFQRLVDLGVFTEDSRVELIGGEIVTMPPMQTPHSSAVTRSNMVFARLFGDTHDVRVQCPFNIPEYSQPEPDFAIITRIVGGLIPHPTQADLIVEVADSSLAYDRWEKSSLYASAGVQEYWILNVQSPSLEVHRDPVTDKSYPFGYRYASVTVHLPNAQVTPLFKPSASILVGNLF